MASRVESFFDHGKVNQGWLTTIAGTIGLTFGPSTLTLLSFGVFVRPLQQEFGWTLGQTTLAATIISYTAMIVAPVQGILTDRLGSRALIIHRFQYLQRAMRRSTSSRITWPSITRFGS